MVRPKRNRRGIATLLAALCVLPPALWAPPSVDAQPVPDKIVWAHQMGVMPNDARMQYGSTYPIVLYDLTRPGERAGLGRQAIDVAVNSGLGGIAFELASLDGRKGPGVPQYIAALKLYAGSDIVVAPCLDVDKKPDTEQTIISAIEQSYAAARAAGNRAIMPDGRLIVFSYSSRNLPPDAWARIRARVEADGYKMMLVGDVGQANLPPVTQLTNAGTVAGAWDAAYNFNTVGLGNVANTNAGFRRALSPRHVAWVGSIMASYYRGINVNPAWGPFGTDGLATGRLRSLWQDILQSHINWVYWVTQNDYVEHTNLFPDSSWGYTRSDMNLWYARKLTGAAYPYGRALYLTTPQLVHAGETPVAELAVINPQDTAMSATVQLVTNTGVVIGSTSVQVAPHQLGAVQLPVSLPANAPYTSARAIAHGPGGSLTSAPILFSRQAKLPNDHGVTTYYSLNSRLTPPTGWHPTIARQGDTITVSGIDTEAVLSVDLLASGNLIDQVKYPSTPVLLSQTRKLKFDRDTNDNKNSGLYAGPPVNLVRIVLKNGAIWYSDPLMPVS